MKWAIICFVVYDVTIIKKGLINLYIVSSEALVTIFCNFLKNPIVLLILLSLNLRCSLKSSLVSKIIPRCLWFVDCMATVLLKFNDGWFGLLSFLEKITSCACLLGSGLKLIFHRNADLFIFFRSPFKFFADKVISWTTENREVSSANSLGFEIKFSERSLINIKKKIGPRNDPWETPALTLAHEEYWPFKTTLCFLASRKSIIKFNKSPLISFCFNLYVSIVPNCIKYLSYIKENTSDFISIIKKFIDFMSNGKELIYTRITWFKTRLVRRN